MGIFIFYNLTQPYEALETLSRDRNVKICVRIRIVSTFYPGEPFLLHVYNLVL